MRRPPHVADQLGQLLVAPRRCAAACADRCPARRTDRCRTFRRWTAGRGCNRCRTAGKSTTRSRFRSLVPSDPVALRHLTAIGGGHRLQGELLLDGRLELVRSVTTAGGIPAVAVAHVHVLDEADRHRCSPAKLRTRSSTVWSLTPRWTTALSLMGASPTSARPRSIPARTRSIGMPRPFMQGEDLRVGGVKAHGDAAANRRPAASAACLASR